MEFHSVAILTMLCILLLTVISSAIPRIYHVNQQARDIGNIVFETSSSSVTTNLPDSSKLKTSSPIFFGSPPLVFSDDRIYFPERTDRVRSTYNRRKFSLRILDHNPTKLTQHSSEPAPDLFPLNSQQSRKPIYGSTLSISVKKTPNTQLEVSATTQKAIPIWWLQKWAKVNQYFSSTVNGNTEVETTLSPKSSNEELDKHKVAFQSLFQLPGVSSRSKCPSNERRNQFGKCSRVYTIKFI